MSDEHPALCVLTHQRDPDKPRKRAWGGPVICKGCLEGLRATLADLPRQHALLARALKPSASNGPHVTVSQGHPLPIDPRVAEHRDDITRQLASWAQMVAEDLGLHGPAHPRLDATVPFLLAHHDWCCSQLWVDEYARELRALANRSHALLYPTGRRRIDLGPCVETVVIHGPACGRLDCTHPTCLPTMPCPGWLTATLEPDEDLLPSAILCSFVTAHTWETRQWLGLGRKLKGVA